MVNPLAALSDQLANAVSAASASTVAILSGGAFVASGVVWKSGIAVTTDHALKKADGKLEVVLPDGRRRDASLQGRAGGVDVAAVRFDGEVAAPALGDPAAVRTGQLMLVAGRSLDTGVNATMGVVSAVSGAWRTWRGGQMDQFIRLDVALFPGVNGGAVVNPEGRVVGVATNALSRIAGVVIPVSTVDAALAGILEGRASKPGYLGVGLHEVEYEGRKVPILLSVMAGGAAAAAGLVVGDLITSINGVAVEKGVRDVWTQLTDIGSGKELNLGIVRGGQAIEVVVVAGERPAAEEEE